MTQYIVSARKYRPDTFETLVGQDNIAQTLKNSIVRGQLAHAYLFCGPRGVGKTSTARIFAKTINCMSPSADMEPCGECESCRSFAEGRSYCIHELDAASNNGVDDIKALMDQVRIPPQVGKYSVYIIDEVHMLSQSAFNAFLKTLEEPPAHAIFILATTEKHKILPTILSRCQTYDFNRITVDKIVGNLRSIAKKEDIKIDDESLHVIAVKADGAMRDALTIFDQTVAFCGADIKYEDVLKNLNVLDYEYSFSLTEAFLKGDYSAALLTFDEILSKGFNALHFIAALSSHFRNLIVAKTAGLDALLELPDSLKVRYRDQAAKCAVQFLFDALGITTQCESGYRASVNPRLHIEFALMKLSLITKSSALGPQPAAAQPAAPRSASPTNTTAPAASTQPASVAQPVEARPASIQPSQPAVTARPAAPAPRTRKARAAAGAALSIKSILDDPQNGTERVDSDAGAEGKMPQDDVLTDNWSKLAEHYSSKPRLANTISSAKLEITSEDGFKVVVFYVANAAQKNWIEAKCLLDMEGNYRSIVGSAKVKLRVAETLDEDKDQSPYTPTEKAKALMSENPEVKNLVTDFGLDIK